MTIRALLVGLVAALSIATLAILFLLWDARHGRPVSPTSVSATFTALAALIALWVALRTVAEKEDERQAARSMFFLESSESALAQAEALLIESNERVAWAAAARLIRNADELSKRITRSEHLLRLEVTRLRYRRSFHSILADKPAAYFFGAKDMTLSADEAAAEATKPIAHAAGTSFPDRTLPIAAIHTVWQASQYPADYHDPLDRQDEFTDDESRWLVMDLRGLGEYVQHRKDFVAFAGKVVPRK